MMFRDKKRQRCGAAAVEFALVSPLLLTFLFGIWELGRVIEVQQILHTAAREAGREASTGTYDETQIETLTRAALKRAGLPANAADTASVSVTNLTSGKSAVSADQLDHIQVTVSVLYADVSWVPVHLFTSSTSQLSASASWYSTRDIPIDVSTTIPLQ